MAAQQAALVGSSHATPATPSRMKPVFQKPSGSIAASNIGLRSVATAAGRCAETRTRFIEEIPVIQPVVTEQTIHRDWYPACRKKVEPMVTQALPGSTLGHRVLVLSAWLHYALGNTLSQIVAEFNFHLPLKLSPGRIGAEVAAVGGSTAKRTGCGASPTKR